MRLLQVSLRSSLIFSLLLVVVSIPVSLFSISALFNEEVDESMELHTQQFLKHIKSYANLDDLETDLEVLDQLSYDIDIKPSSNQMVSRAFRTTEIYDSVEHELRSYRELSNGVDIKGRHYVLTVRMALVDNKELILTIGLVQSFLIILLAAGLLLLNRRISKRLWKPFYKTLNQLKAYQLDRNEAIETDKTNITEFDDLNTTVRMLTDRNRKVFLDQKEFIENASHELQTPIAIFQSKLDLMMQNPSMSESEAGMISELEMTAQRMSRLNKNLLLLSKIDNDQFSTKEIIDVTWITKEILYDIKSMADVEAISISHDILPVEIMANRTLIEVLITNLLNNAVRHNVNNGFIRLSLNEGRLTIVNSGPKVQMPPEKMFARFSKESANTSSSGLGLAIVKRVCDSCGYKLNYRYEESHIFTVVF
ncbi:MAG: HAMP domain-containing sensor histidine kinase [Chryseolinea sp.]